MGKRAPVPMPDILKEDRLTELFQKFLNTMGIQDDNAEIDLHNTPRRVARMYVWELLSGYDESALSALKVKFTTFPKAHAHEMVVIKDTYFTSLCAHHLMPFFGTISMGYIPKHKVIGLSKFPRAVALFAARLQTQENLTTQLAEFIMENAEPTSLVVLAKAQHLCCSARGVRQPGVSMVTSAIRGDMPLEVKEEFYRLLEQ